MSCWISVFDAKQAMSVLTAADGVLAAARGGLIVVVLSTVTIRELRELDTVCAQAGVTLLDAGVSDGSEAARNGMVVMVGGPDDAVARALPVLEGFGKKVAARRPAWRRNGRQAGPQRADLHRLGGGAGGCHHCRGGRRAPRPAVRGAGKPASAAATTPSAGCGARSKACASPLSTPTSSTRWLRRTWPRRRKGLAGEADVEVPLAKLARPRYAGLVFGGELGEPLPEDPDKRGRAMMDRVYGPRFKDNFPAEGMPPWSVDTIEHLFGQILEPAAPDRPRPATDGDRGDRHAGRPRPVGDPDGQRVRQRRIHPCPASGDRGYSCRTTLAGLTAARPRTPS